jgi:hypothetical protein
MPALVEALEQGRAIVDAKLLNEGKHVFPLDWDELEPWLGALLDEKLD